MFHWPGSRGYHSLLPLHLSDFFFSYDIQRIVITKADCVSGECVSSGVKVAVLYLELFHMVVKTSISFAPVNTTNEWADAQATCFLAGKYLKQELLPDHLLVAGSTAVLDLSVPYSTVCTIMLPIPRGTVIVYLMGGFPRDI